MTAKAPLLRATNITKRFPRCIALDNVSLDVNSGEIHILYGESGAGRTTLVKVLTGVYPPDKGKIYIKDRLVKPRNSEHARSLGISAVYQEFSLAPELGIVANLFLGREIRKGIFLDTKQMESEARAYLERLKFNPNINLDKKVYKLSLADQQIIEIARSLMQEVSILLLDEPTPLMNESEKKVLFEIIKMLKAEGKGIVYISRVMDELMYIGDRATILRDGKKVGIIQDKKDITESTLLSSLSGVVFKRKATSDIPIEYVSPNIEGQFGYKAESLSGGHKPYIGFMHPEDGARVAQEIATAAKSNSDHIEQEYRVRCADGNYKWVIDRTEIIRDRNGLATHYHGFITDITKPRQVEEALRQSEEKYKTLIKNIPDTIYSALPSIKSPMVFISDRYQDWTGHSPDGFYRNPDMWIKSVHPKDRKRAVAELSRAIKQKKEYVSEYRVVHKDTGEIHHVIDHSIPVINAKGDITRFDGIITDITARKRAERELQESQEFLSNVLSNAPNPTVIVNPDTSIRHVNPAFEKLTGFSAEEVIEQVAPYPWWTAQSVQAISGNLIYQGMFEEVRNKEYLFKKKGVMNSG